MVESIGGQVEGEAGGTPRLKRTDSLPTRNALRERRIHKVLILLEESVCTHRFGDLCASPQRGETLGRDAAAAGCEDGRKEMRTPSDPGMGLSAGSGGEEGDLCPADQKRPRAG